MNRVSPIVYIVATALVVGIAVFGLNLHHAHAATEIPQASQCMPSGPSEICPNQEFLNAWAHWKDLQKQVTDALQDEKIRELQGKQDEWLGLQDRLKNMVPQNYTFDETKRKFIANKVDPGTSSHAPQTPAPPAKK